jgi:hypothetical protein
MTNYTSYDHSLFNALRTGEKKISEVVLSNEEKAPYLGAVIQFSDQAFVEAVESGIPFPTKKGDISDLVSTAYDLNRENSIKLLKPIASVEVLSDILNRDIACFDKPYLWFDDTEKWENSRNRLIRDGAVISNQNKKLISDMWDAFNVQTQRLWLLL